MARQVAKQVEHAFGSELDEDINDPNTLDTDELDATEPALPPSHLPTLISSLPTLGRPIIVVLDAFDLFAEHGRQALLYCLLDTAQSCRAGTDTMGLAVVGVTARVDTLNLLEKRVKSRFSGRMLRTAGPRSTEGWSELVSGAMLSPMRSPNDEWSELWNKAVKRFLMDRAVREMFEETFGLVRDVRKLCQILVRSSLTSTLSVVQYGSR
jgi:origin recognition complex subunit 4